MNLLKKVVIAVTAATLMAGAALAVSAKDTGAADRLAPVGKVCMAGDSCAGGAAVIAAGEPRSGEEVYNTKCMSCHNTGVGGAPKKGVAADWAPRIAKGSESLFNNAWNGLNAMPPKGICMDCSEAEMQASIDYMIK